jgi:hypothetical protein
MSRSASAAQAKPHPVEILREAVAVARARGFVVQPGDHGVRPVPSKHLIAWEVDSEDRRIISPFGALLLHAQPQSAEFLPAVAISLGAELAYVEAFLCGINHEPPPPDWAREVNVWDRIQALEHGTRYRAHLMANGRPS